jgi:hypothetical protein
MRHQDWHSFPSGDASFDGQELENYTEEEYYEVTNLGYDFGGVAPDGCAFVVYLSEVTELSGAFRAFEGSHLLGALASEPGAKHLSQEDWDDKVSTPVEGEPGDLLIFPPTLVHESPGNDHPELWRKSWLQQAYNSVTNPPLVRLTGIQGYRDELPIAA